MVLAQTQKTRTKTYCLSLLHCKSIVVRLFKQCLRLQVLLVPAFWVLCTHSLSLSHTHIITHAHSLYYTHTHTHTHTQVNSNISLSLSLSLSLSSFLLLLLFLGWQPLLPILLQSPYYLSIPQSCLKHSTKKYQVLKDSSGQPIKLFNTISHPPFQKIKVFYQMQPSLQC